MRFVVGLLLASQLSLAPPVHSQARRQPERYFIEPPESVLTVIASQPNCGIEFTKAIVAHGVDGGVGHIYQVRNRGPKAVREYKVVSLTSGGTGAEWSYQAKESDGLFMAGEVRPKSLESFGVELVPLTDRLREKHRLHGPPIGIAVFLIVRVVYADGTEYDGKSEYQTIKEFLEKDRASAPR